jgi:hypothetical protein
MNNIFAIGLTIYHSPCSLAVEVVAEASVVELALLDLL